MLSLLSSVDNLECINILSYIVAHIHNYSANRCLGHPGRRPRHVTIGPTSFSVSTNYLEGMKAGCVKSRQNGIKSAPMNSNRPGPFKGIFHLAVGFSSD